MPDVLLKPEIEANLPSPPTPVGSYVPCIRVGNLLYTSGTLPMRDGNVLYKGAVGGVGVPLEQGQEAAKLCTMNLLSILKGELGSLDKVKRIVKLTGFVNSASAFYQQPAVLNAASDLLVEIFGERGKHVRSAVGVSALPLNASVEIEMIAEIEGD